mmetsp:Transcript_15098/g.61803  ORF Transcript_15098/g.61803 Transcript_15098/m.61803 type:complete len:142 (-) Transcript_15098:1141-1566(-)
MKRSQVSVGPNEMEEATRIGKKGEGGRETIERIDVRPTTGGTDAMMRDERKGVTGGETTEETTVGMTVEMTVAMTVGMTVAMTEEMIAEKEGETDHRGGETMIDRGIPEIAEEVGMTARTGGGLKMTAMMMSAHRRGAGGK